MALHIDPPAGDPLLFYVTGRLPGEFDPRLSAARPALLAAYSDLAALRYDFPLVLTETGVPAVRTLSGLIDELLEKTAPPENERLRSTVLRLERTMRGLASGGERLSALWDRAAAELAAADPAAAEPLQTAREAFAEDGEVVACGPDAANRLAAHLWSAVEEDKARRLRADIDRLIARLTDILKADYLRSAEGRSAETLRSGIGAAQQTLFDFSRLSDLLPKSTPREALSPSQRRRIDWALETLRKQHFSPGADGGAAPLPFRFESCDEALAAYRARLPELVELAKAIAVAELEIDGAYTEERHDAVFAAFDSASLGPEISARFPGYLVLLEEGREANADLLAALSSGVPLKILLNVGDLLAESRAGKGHAVAIRNARLAGLAAALGEVFVLQTPVSNLYHLGERFRRGLAFAGPALFSVYLGKQQRNLPSYLDAAAAFESRAFPAFSYDPQAGRDLASRFSLENNPQPEADWPVATLEYGDGELQRVRAETAFTFVDFLFCDAGYRHHFSVPPARFQAENLVPAAAWMARPDGQAPGSVPFILAAGNDDTMARLVVNERAIVAARDCLENWHRLQEMGGVHNSHVERLLQKKEEKREAAAPEVAPAPAPAPAPEPAEAGPERSPDEAYIETERCSSCNECTQINNRLFAYNPNKQAYILDLDAGTYAQLVEAAENCQLGIIHPGKPRDSAEPGLDELLKRAQPFR